MAEDSIRSHTGVGGASTINDVARLAGVSIKTVSRVMNNEPNVRQETRDKVQAAADSLRYRPNLLARSLAGSRSFLLALFYDNPNANYINDMQRGVIRRTRESNYHLLIEPQDSQAPDLAQRITNLLGTIRLDGVILTPPLCDMPVVLDAIEAAGVPYVRVSSVTAPERSATVAMNESKAAYEMTQYLLTQGHTDIGFVLGHPDHGASHLRHEGFRRAMDEAGLTVPPERVGQGYFSYESGVEAGDAILSAPTRPTAIFASSDYMALGVMTSARKLGLRIPEDISICGFDDVPGAMRIWPALTTIRHPAEALAYAAADILLCRETGEGAADAQQILPFRLIERQSVRKL
ncbi:LacI family DNA-binding transcriptional regulator [Asticcacaulis sp. BYS171W]|uniref:LacI family DNA-binding transcriptional regulator n=1 Tax=Asticcacaulis aquaticus TaxID=2984212 RepID=A0ABT5HUC1_9CAUL|nr:LacI family DNA-binding transcriptional regulator [Asticcacaulis aquaticus]MDC7683644.1 LacI family DNA-binding transcriptional regulator [Asticcacaulis aquaticus]